MTARYEARPCGAGFAVFEVATGQRVTPVWQDEGKAVRTAKLRNHHANRRAENARRERPCLTCTKPFPSEGAHNRMCTHCRSTKGAGEDFSQVQGARHASRFS